MVLAHTDFVKAVAHIRNRSYKIEPRALFIASVEAGWAPWATSLLALAAAARVLAMLFWQL